MQSDMKKVLYIDFDKTLFDLDTFRSHIYETLSAAGVDPGEYADTVDEYHDWQGGSVKYRLYQAKQHVLDTLPIDWEEFEQLVLSFTDDHDFCYRDAHDYIAQARDLSDVEVRILTYGHTDGQMLKIRTCNHIAGLPIDIVREPKADFLSRQTGIVGVLIDDKHQLNLPDHVQHIWINRTSKDVEHGAHAEVVGLDITDLRGTHLQ